MQATCPNSWRRGNSENERETSYSVAGNHKQTILLVYSIYFNRIFLDFSDRADLSNIMGYTHNKTPALCQNRGL